MHNKWLELYVAPIDDVNTICGFSSMRARSLWKDIYFCWSVMYAKHVSHKPTNSWQEYFVAIGFHLPEYIVRMIIIKIWWPIEKLASFTIHRRIQANFKELMVVGLKIPMSSLNPSAVFIKNETPKEQQHQAKWKTSIFIIVEQWTLKGNTFFGMRLFFEFLIQSGVIQVVIKFVMVFCELPGSRILVFLICVPYTPHRNEQFVKSFSVFLWQKRRKKQIISIWDILTGEAWTWNKCVLCAIAWE